MTVHAAAQTGFNVDASRYARGRPDYPAEVTGWLRRKRLDERSFLLRHARITAELGALFAPPPAATG